MIGVIGGAGVSATNKLTEIIEETLTKQGAFRDAHHPEMVIFQATKAPSRSMFLENRGPSFVPDYIQAAKKLEQFGSGIICMSCNTAHYAIDDIQESINIPVINMIEEVIKSVKQTGRKKIGLIASDGCLLGGVYEKYFQKIYPDSEIIYPDKKHQILVTKGICNIKNTARFETLNSENRPVNIFTKVCKHLKERGAELTIVGCTDIRVDFTYPNTVDSLEVLAQSILKHVENE